MNTRLQVEHPVTEAGHGPRPGRAAAARRGRRAAAARAGRRARSRGHAIEARIYAEDPGPRLPARRRARPRLPPPAGLRASMTRSRPGSGVGTAYDPMLAKVIVHGGDRAQPRCAGCARALGETGVARRPTTNAGFLRALLGDADGARRRDRHRPDRAPAARRRPPIGEADGRPRRAALIALAPADAMRRRTTTRSHAPTAGGCSGARAPARAGA